MSEVFIRHPPSGDSRLNVVFVHGLGGDASKTWAYDETEANYWPDWLHDECSGVGVFALQYPAAPSEWLGHAMPIQDRGVNVLSRLLAEDLLLSRRCLFVGHSLGGLVTKQLLHAAKQESEKGNERAQRLLDAYCGAVFLATPHYGSAYAHVLQFFGAVAQASAAIRDLERENAHLHTLNEWFRHWALLRPSRHKVFFETQGCPVGPETGAGRFLGIFSRQAARKTFGLIVERSSANPNLTAVTPQPLDKDHLSICKPVNRRDEVFVHVRDFVRALAANPPTRPEVFDFLNVPEDLPKPQAAALAREAAEAIPAKAAEPVERGNEGEDIGDTLSAARGKLKVWDTAGALATLDEKLAEERDALADRRQRALLLLLEKADIQRLTYDHAGRRATLMEMRAVSPLEAFVALLIGDLELLSGNTGAARKAYAEARTLAEKVGDLRQQGVALDRLGEVLLLQGNSVEALSALREALKIAETLVEADTGNAQAKRDLSVAHSKLGEAMMHTGDYEGALNAFFAALTIREERAKANPRDIEAQRDLAAANDSVGNALMRHTGSGEAYNFYEAALSIVKKLAKARPNNVEVQRELSISYTKLGDVLMEFNSMEALKAYRASLAIDEARVKANSDNSEAQRDLSATHTKIGEALMSQNNSIEALEAFRASLAIDEARARADPEDAVAQTDLSTSHEGIGDALIKQGEIAKAIEHYRASLHIRIKRAESDPNDVQVQRLLAVSYVKMSEVEPNRAREWLAKAFVLVEALREKGRLAPADNWMIADLRARVRLASLS